MYSRTQCGFGNWSLFIFCEGFLLVLLFNVKIWSSEKSHCSGSTETDTRNHSPLTGPSKSESNFFLRLNFCLILTKSNEAKSAIIQKCNGRCDRGFLPMHQIYNSGKMSAHLGFVVFWFLRSLWGAVWTRLSLRLQRQTVRNGVEEEEGVRKWKEETREGPVIAAPQIKIKVTFIQNSSNLQDV